LKQTSDKDADVTNFRRIVGVLQAFPGDDEVNLVVDNDKKIFKLRIPALMRVDYCPELHRRLAELVGEERLKLEG
jgi:hypothetical protein